MESASYFFPMAQYRRASEDLALERKIAMKDRETWQSVRNKQRYAKLQELDRSFKENFEKLQNFFFRISNDIEEAENILKTLKTLTSEGASAEQLDVYELGGFNLVGITKALPELTSEKELALAAELVKISLTANADVSKLKAYAGNGGVPSLYWLCDYLSAGIGPAYSQLKNEQQYSTAFRIFRMILAYTPEATQTENYCLIYLRNFHEDEHVAHMQLQTYLWLIRSLPAKKEAEHYYQGMFSAVPLLVKNKSFSWLPLLFPYPEDEIARYKEFLQLHLKDTDSGAVLNGFKASKEGRAFFQQYFSKGKHWLLSELVSHPDIIFSLVRNHELKILEPFCKLYKNELAQLRDRKGLNLLQAAQQSGKSAEKLAAKLKFLDRTR